MTQTIYLNTDRKQTTPVVHMVQGDTGRELECHITDRVLTGTDSAAIWCERPDGSVWSAVGTISGNVATFALGSGGPLNQAGQVKTQVKITDTNSLVVSTFDLVIEVHQNVSGQSTPADETWRDSLAASLQADIDSKVPQTTTVNGKALGSNIVLNAEDIPFDNTGTELSSTDVQGAIEELFPAKFVIRGYKSVSANSADDLVSLDIIDDRLGYYFIVLQAGTNTTDCAAAYLLLYGNQAGVYNLSPVFEGTGSRAPRITSSGVLKLNTQTSASQVHYAIFELG